MSKENQCGVNAANYELYFLITKFLEAGPCSKSAQVLKEELIHNEIIPKRYDWEGNAHPQSYNEFERKYPHIGSEHLGEICKRIIPLLDKEFPSSVAGLKSLLGTGKQSIMRTERGPIPNWRSLVECSIRRHQNPLPRSITCRNHHIVNVLHGRELSGPFSRSQAFPPILYSRMQLLCRTLGHLSSVYCVLFDGSGKYVITGADDMLIKVWSAIDGRLLATLRGVLSEVTDIAINVENTLLAAGNVDRVIRVWCLQTGHPVAVLLAHSGMITGVNFCPRVINGVHYLASTSTDGSVAFWSYTVGPNQTVNFQSRALQYNERLRPGQAQMICASFSPGGMFLAAGSADHHVRVYKMIGSQEYDAPHRILETEPHTDRVDSIQWAHSGLRFISGSKDGTAIIWKFTRQRWKTQVLNMATKLPGKCVETDLKQKLKVTMVCWNANDSCAITASNDFSIKVWDSETAKLCQVLKGHKEEVFVLESHPFDSDVLLSAGHDGLILLWDLNSGTQLTSFLNSVDTQNNGAVYDAKWSPDGTMVAATDSHGHILLFGLGFVSERIKKLPKELFFHTDYRPLVRDESQQVLDEQTQVAPHLMPPPFLVDVDGNPYPPYLQRLVPGRENCHTEQLVPNIIMSSDGLQEVIEGVDADERRSHIDHMIQQLVQRSDQASPISQSRPSTSPRSARIRGRGDVEGVRQSSGNWQKDEFTWTRRRLIPFLEKGRFEVAKEKVNSAADFEIEEYNRELQRPLELKPAPMTSAEFVKRPRKRQTHAYRTRASRVEHMLQNDEEGEGLTPTASEDSSSHNDSTARSEDMDSSSSDTSSSDYSDWIADNGMEPPKRNKRTCNKNKLPKTPPAAAAAAATASTSTAAVKKQTVQDVPELYRPSEWLSEVIPKKFPYYPQMGDEALFFREGYQNYLDAVKSRGVYDLQPSQITPWGKINIKEPELVKIIGIKYELRPPRLCCLRLAVMKQNGKLTGDRFTIKYHDVPDVIDFLVLRQTYETAVARNWDVGDRFRSMIDDKWWWGEILSRRSDAQSDFLSYFTQWDNGEQENMSPWDMEPVDSTREPVVEEAGVPVLPEEIAAILYHPRPDEWPGGSRDIACDRILRGLDDIMGLSVAEPFIAPVDINQYPTYAFIVEYPIDLSTIKGRFENRFYRRVTAAQFDVRYLATNAEKFNEDHSPILRHARIVTDLCLRVIKEVSDIDVPVLYRQLLEAYRSESSDEAFDPNKAGPSTSRQSTRTRTLRPSRRTRPQLSALTKDTTFDWRRACKELLDCLWANKDSEPFREPVDRMEHPDYDKIISTPMDLWTVREELRGNNYENHKEFYKDVQLIFTNSKKYSPDPRSRIYGMTSRMSSLAEKLMDDLLQKWKTSRRLNRGRKARNRKPRKKAAQQNDNGVPSDSEEEQSSRTSPAKPTHNERMQTRVVKKEVKYTMSSSASDQDETINEETPMKLNHKVNGYGKQRPRRVLNMKKNKFAEEDEEEEEEEEEEESDNAGEGTSGINNLNEHNYHSTVRGRSRVEAKEGVSRKRKKPPKPHSDSESNNTLAENSSNRPQRSVQRKNYAAMVASGSDSAEDPSVKHPQDSKNSGKSIKKKSFVSPKKDTVREGLPHRSMPRSSAVVYPQSTSGKMQMRPLKKEMNYDENRSGKSSDNDDSDDDDDDDDDEDKEVNVDEQENEEEEISLQENTRKEHQKKIVKRSRETESVQNTKTREHQEKGNSSKEIVNGVLNSRTTRIKTKVVYNEEYDDSEDDGEIPYNSEHENKKEAKKKSPKQKAKPSHSGKVTRHFDEDLSAEEGDSSEEISDDDHSMPNWVKSFRANRDMGEKSNRKDVSRASNSSSRSNSDMNPRKRRKIDTDSDSDANNLQLSGTSSRPQAGRRKSDVVTHPSKSRLRRSKRPHRPIREGADNTEPSTGETSSEPESSPPQISISSRGRLRKISPRVRAFLAD